MEKLMTREMKDKKKQRNQLIVGGILIALMLMSTAGYALSDKEGNSPGVKKVNYNGIDFLQDDSEYWNFKLNGYDFVTQYNPEDTKEIKNYNRKLLNDYSNEPLYFVGEANAGFSEIEMNLARFVLRIRPACMTSNCSGDYPIKSCSEDNLIIFEEANETFSEGILQDKNCIFIKTNELNQTKYADSFLFGVLGI
jgi:hypothetical protein